MPVWVWILLYVFDICQFYNTWKYFKCVCLKLFVPFFFPLHKSTNNLYNLYLSRKKNIFVDFFLRFSEITKMIYMKFLHLLKAASFLVSRKKKICMTNCVTVQKISKYKKEANNIKTACIYATRLKACMYVTRKKW